MQSRYLLFIDMIHLAEDSDRMVIEDNDEFIYDNDDICQFISDNLGIKLSQVEKMSMAELEYTGVVYCSLQGSVCTCDRDRR